MQGQSIMTMLERNSNQTDPNKLLMLRILVKAMQDLYTKPVMVKGMDSRTSAITWFKAPNDYIYSFKSICKHLGIDTDIGNFVLDRYKIGMPVKIKWNNIHMDQEKHWKFHQGVTQ